MNVYDFDKTIFYPDSSYSFFCYCLKTHTRAVLRAAPAILSASALYACRLIPTKRLKEKLFSFLRYVPEPESLVKRFWDERFTGVGEWYLRQKRPDDLIITASPEFLVGEAASRLGVRMLGTRMDIHTGRIDGENCHDSEKLRRFRAAFPEDVIEEFYSDSRSDQPLADAAQKAFLVRKGTLSPWHAN